MPRIVVLLLVAIVSLWAMLGFVAHQSQRAARGTFRPRRRFGMGKGGAGLAHLVRREELAGTRDAYSSAPIDPDAEIYRCGACLAFYHADSLRALTASNEGRCAACGSRDITPAQVVAD
jgi:DNA-directed RNA polymerase subunit RPC12/RpoP